MSDRVAARVLVRGRVQGVGYRASCARRARERDVAGWAHNLPSGEVEVHLEGAPDDVAAVVAWTRSGPPGAIVADVIVTDVPPERVTGFTTG